MRDFDTCLVEYQVYDVCNLWLIYQANNFLDVKWQITLYPEHNGKEGCRLVTVHQSVLWETLTSESPGCLSTNANIYTLPIKESTALWSAFLTNSLAYSKALVWVSKVTQWLSVRGLLQKQFVSTNWILRTCQRLCWILETQILTKFLLARSSEQNSLILMMSNVSNCCFMTHAFGIVSRNSLLNLS